MQRSLCTSKQVGGTYRAPSARRYLLPCTYRFPSARSGLLSFKCGPGFSRHRPKRLLPWTSLSSSKFEFEWRPPPLEFLNPNPVEKTLFLPLKRRRLGHILIISRVGYVISDFWNQYINRLNSSKTWPCKGPSTRPGKLGGRTEHPPHGQTCSHARTDCPLHGQACFHGPGKRSSLVRANGCAEDALHVKI